MYIFGSNGQHEVQYESKVNGEINIRGKTNKIIQRTMVESMLIKNQDAGIE